MSRAILGVALTRASPLWNLGCAVLCTATLVTGSMAAASPAEPAARHTLDTASAATHAHVLSVPPASLVSAVAQTLADHSPETWAARLTSKDSAVLTNPVQHLTVNLARHGTVLKLDGTEHGTLVMQLLAYRLDADSQPLNPGKLTVHGARTERSWSTGLTQWYVNSPLGLEQGFFVAVPAATAPRSIQLIFKLGGGLKPVFDGHALEFRPATGSGVLRYDNLFAYDAQHRALPARMRLVGKRLSLQVDTRGAVFPVTVDPLFSTHRTFSAPLNQSDSYFAYNVALSADGNTALVGDVGANIGGQSGEGVAYVYTRSGGVWSATPHVFSDPPAQSDAFGSSVALSADGNLALIGAFNTTVSGQPSAGKVYVYTRSGGVWSVSPSQIFSDPAAARGDEFGSSVALSADGDTALIGAEGTAISGQAAAGKAYVYTYSAGSWSLTQTFNDPGGAAQDQFGLVVALSATSAGSALIGSWHATVAGQTGAGKAYVYNQSGGVWPSLPTQSFSDPAATAGDNFGLSVALSADASTALIGAPGTKFDGTNQAGKAYVYSQSGGVWSTTPSVFGNPTDGADNGGFGSSGALSSDGDVALIGAPHGALNDVGAAYAFARSAGVWSTTPIATLSDPPAKTGDAFGNSVSLSADGTAALVGADGTGTSTALFVGAAYVFDSTVDLSLALSSNPGNVNRGQNVTYMLTVTNNDTQVTDTNISLTDSVPAGMSYVSANAAGGTCSGTATVTCTLASLAPSATWQPSITVTANQAGRITDSATVSADQPDPNPANNTASTTTTVNISGVTPPTASNGSVTTVVNSAVNGTLVATDPQHFSLIFAVVSPAAHGTATITNSATGAFTYTPAAGYHGSDTFTFQATNSAGAVSNTATESITVNDVAPIAHNGSISTTAGQSVSGTLSATAGYSGQQLTFAVVTQPLHGTVTVTPSTGAFTYAPASGYSGSDNFAFTAGDGTVTSNTGTETVTVNVAPSGGGGGSSSGGGGAMGMLGLLLLMGAVFRSRLRRG